MWFLISKIHLSGWIAERTDRRNLALDSAWSSGSIISQLSFPQWIASRSDLADSVSPLMSLNESLKRFTTVQIMFEFPQTWIRALLLWNFSKSRSRKISTESPLSRTKVKISLALFPVWGFLFILVLIAVFVGKTALNCI